MTKLSATLAITIFLGSLVSGGLLSGADPLAELFARMDKTAAHFVGMTASIRETSYTAVVNDSDVSNGTIALRTKPDLRFLVDFTSDPKSPKAVALAGNEAQLYNPKTRTVQIYDVSTRKDAIQQAMTLGFGATSAEVKAIYEVAWVGPEKLDGQAVAHISLTPKTKEMQAQMKQADLWISDALGVPVQQKLLSAGGNYTLFQYSNLKLTSSLSDKDLKLKAPKGVQTSRVGN
jgi:outer membrane lipoprotein-sorting protein